MTQWANFFMGVSGTSGALIGLLFVGISINLKTILRYKSLPLRALKAFFFLLITLLISLSALVPTQSVVFFGVRVLVAGLFASGAEAYLSWRIYGEKKKQLGKSINKYRLLHSLQFVVNQIAALSYLASGAILLSGDLSGLNWLVSAMLISLVVVSMDAWVLLIEINR